MKTSKTKGLLLAMLMIATVAGSAAASGKLKVSPYLRTNYAIVSAVVASNDGARLAIRDSYGSVLYRSHKIDNSETFQKLLDLSSLPDGDYKVVLEGKTIKEVSSFTVKANRLVSEMSVMASEAPKTNTFIRKSDDMLYVSHLNPELKTSTLAIYDKSGELVFTSTLPVKDSYSGLFKINSLPKGEYSVSLTTGKNSYNYEFSK
jgi:hypothetical protein